MNEETWKQWIENINWFINNSKNNNWDTDELIVKLPISEKEFELFEDKMGITYPADFKHIITHYSSGIEMSWHIGDFDYPDDEEFIEIFGAERFWDIGFLMEEAQHYTWAEAYPDDKYWKKSAPLILISNGDVIAFNRNDIKKESEVIYLSHDLDPDAHGQKLGDNFIDFMNRWTNVGCLPDFTQLEVFYDYEKNQIKLMDPLIERWKKCLTE